MEQPGTKNKLYKLPGREIITIVMGEKEQNKIGEEEKNQKKIYPSLTQTQAEVRKYQYSMFCNMGKKHFSCKIMKLELLFTLYFEI